MKQKSLGAFNIFVLSKKFAHLTFYGGKYTNLKWNTNIRLKNYV